MYGVKGQEQERGGGSYNRQTDCRRRENVGEKRAESWQFISGRFGAEEQHPSSKTALLCCFLIDVASGRTHLWGQKYCRPRGVGVAGNIVHASSSSPSVTWGEDGAGTQDCNEKHISTSQPEQMKHATRTPCNAPLPSLRNPQPKVRPPRRDVSVLIRRIRSGRNRINLRKRKGRYCSSFPSKDFLDLPSNTLDRPTTSFVHRKMFTRAQRGRHDLSPV